MALTHLWCKLFHRDLCSGAALTSGSLTCSLCALWPRIAGVESDLATAVLLHAPALEEFPRDLLDSPLANVCHWNGINRLLKRLESHAVSYYITSPDPTYIHPLSQLDNPALWPRFIMVTSEHGYLSFWVPIVKGII